MSRKPENVFIASVHRLLPPVTLLYRMKNNNDYNSGIADCWYSGPRGDLWIEYKFLELPKRDKTIIDLVGGKDPMITPLQQQWLAERLNEGRDCWVIVGCKDGGALFKKQQWGTPLATVEFKRLLKTRAELATLIEEHVGVLDEPLASVYNDQGPQRGVSDRVNVDAARVHRKARVETTAEWLARKAKNH